MACGAGDEFAVLHAGDGAVFVEFGFEDGFVAGEVELALVFGDAAMAAAFGAPAVRGVEGKKAWVEWLEGALACGAGAVGGENHRLGGLRAEADGAFADFQGTRE